MRRHRTALTIAAALTAATLAQAGGWQQATIDPYPTGRRLARWLAEQHGVPFADWEQHAQVQLDNGRVRYRVTDDAVATPPERDLPDGPDGVAAVRWYKAQEQAAAVAKATDPDLTSPELEAVIEALRVWINDIVPPAKQKSRADLAELIRGSYPTNRIPSRARTP